MKRDTFLKRSFEIGALVAFSPLINTFSANARTGNISVQKDDFLQRLIKANDNQVSKLLQSVDPGTFSRRIANEFAILAASYSANDSAYYQSLKIIPLLEKIMDILVKAQSDDGTVSIGNLESPPDTAFLLEPLCAATYILRQVRSEALSGTLERMDKFILQAGEALKSGGVHTPNHRWVISAALARINQLFPNKQYVDRIEDWLGEGVFIDKDGHFPERSINYAFVENKSFIIISRLLNRPSLLDAVRKNLEMTYYYMDPDGNLITTDSRRQDQYLSRNILSWYLLYRYLAIRDNNGMFAAIAREIEKMDGFEEIIMNQSLFYFLEDPSLQKPLPASVSLPVDYEKFFTTSQLVRIRRNSIATTLFGGVDRPLIIASGRSNSPNLFSFRKGKAILNYLRVSSDFFSTGYFYSEGIKKEGGKYVLHNKLTVPYYQPLPKSLRNPSGDYTLSPSIDGRFWNKMSFAKRPISNVKTLETSITFSENNGRNELDFFVKGMNGVEVTIELCFKSGGTLTGSLTGNDTGDNNFLESGMGKYEYKGDTITFGPGALDSKKINNLEGERYSAYFGTLRTEGTHVYITGKTPFEHKLLFY